MVGPSQIQFGTHKFHLGSDEAARVDFHRMLTALISVKHPTATQLRANPGDWGIDTFVGSLVEKVNVWQSKYFTEGLGSSQQAQIRKSFNSAVTNAAKYGYKLESWTLCVALELDPKERLWWDRKVKAWKKEHPALAIDLWDEPRLRTMLMQPEARPVFDAFYSDARDWGVEPTVASGLVVRAFHEVPEDLDLDGALFAMQMREAGIAEHGAQKNAFFNAEILCRDVTNRGIPEQMAALAAVDNEVWEIWEERVADSGAHLPDALPEAPRSLFAEVMRQIRKSATPEELRGMRSTHQVGMMHRVVEDSRAGWVGHWRDVAAGVQPFKMNTALPTIDDEPSEPGGDV